jgi:Sulfotransferase domain
LKRINCISSPRNISTALMYSFAQRNDTTVFDEPFYAFYLNQSGRIHPGRKEILNSQPHTFEEVFSILNHSDSDILYIKNMAHHMRLIPLAHFEDYINVLLIRNPSLLIASFARIIENPDMLDIGLEDQYRIWKHFEDLGRDVIIIDSGELLTDPKNVMHDFCDRLEISFKDTMLQWNPGARPEDGVWARYWYYNVHKSVGFEKQPTSSRPFPVRCKELLDEALPLYEQLYSHAIKAR